MTYQDIARALVEVGKEKSEWAGLPVPIEGQRLVLEKNHPYKELETLGEPAKEDGEEDFEVVNMWFSYRLRGNVILLREKKTGKLFKYLESENQAAKLIQTMMATVAWPLESEHRAIHKLAEMIRNHLFVSYLLVGAFIETSPRSGITYMFRKLRPTLAIKQDTMLCALCRHAIGFYDGTWAGVTCPTDEVIAHLVWMRADEHGFWKGCNQHPIKHPSAGL